MERQRNDGNPTANFLSSLKDWAPAIIVLGGLIAGYYGIVGSVQNNTSDIAEYKRQELPSRTLHLEDDFKALQDSQTVQNSAIQSEIQSLQVAQHETANAVGAQGQTLASIQASLGLIISQALPVAPRK